MAKTEKDCAEQFQKKIAEFSSHASKELEKASYEERVAWIKQVKEEGDLSFKAYMFHEAIDRYMLSLCGFDFAKYPPTPS